MYPRKGLKLSFFQALKLEVHAPHPTITTAEVGTLAALLRLA